MEEAKSSGKRTLKQMLSPGTRAKRSFAAARGALSRFGSRFFGKKPSASAPSEEAKGGETASTPSKPVLTYQQFHSALYSFVQRRVVISMGRARYPPSKEEEEAFHSRAFSKKGSKGKNASDDAESGALWMQPLGMLAHRAAVEALMQEANVQQESTAAASWYPGAPSLTPGIQQAMLLRHAAAPHHRVVPLSVHIVRSDASSSDRCPFVPDSLALPEANVTALATSAAQVVQGGAASLDSILPGSSMAQPCLSLLRVLLDANEYLARTPEYINLLALANPRMEAKATAAAPGSSDIVREPKPFLSPAATAFPRLLEEFFIAASLAPCTSSPWRSSRCKLRRSPCVHACCPLVCATACSLPWLLARPAASTTLPPP